MGNGGVAAMGTAPAVRRTEGTGGDGGAAAGDAVAGATGGVEADSGRRLYVSRTGGTGTRTAKSGGGGCGRRW